MCGVLGFISKKNRKDMGEISSKLLRMLEYRGYDSTGAAIQNGKDIELRKDVGSPTEVTKRLNIYELEGRIFCGQVRWATFGTVTKENAQPHDVKCHTHIYGAHNGNITNCDQLKETLIKAGHDIKSDNDGEMLVHVIEHYFAMELEKIDDTDNEKRKIALKNAILKANEHIVGSFASVVVDPISETMACIKAGSSLYMGKGYDENYGEFMVVSSDLSAVLSQTKILIPIKEKEFVIYNDHEFEVFNIKSGEKLEKIPFRSKLKIEETELKPPFKYFMEQEIHAQIGASERLIDLFTGNSSYIDFIKKNYSENADLIKNIKHGLLQLSEIIDLQELKKRGKMFLESEEFIRFKKLVENEKEIKFKSSNLESSNGVFFRELSNILDIDLDTKLLDAIFLLDEVTDIENRVTHFVNMIVKAYEYGSSIYLLACGTSFHAAKSCAIFFDRIAGLNLYPLLPGEFRAQYANSLRDRDVIIGISQSGETKDLIDIFNMVENSGKDISLISIVNNSNSSLALEKSELFIPLFCGPEIAVPATKSFLNQLLVLYILALRVSERFNELGIKKIDEKKLKTYGENLHKIPQLIEKTIEESRDSIDEISELLYLEPSIHILATGMLGIAKEAALKIREVVLNHTEGFEGSEFKHGPNTILGVNTIFGLNSIRAVLQKYGEMFSSILEEKNGEDFTAKDMCEFFKDTSNYVFFNKVIEEESKKDLLLNSLKSHNFFESLYSNYPLIFATASDDRDVNLTISQINTHKIRGANIFIVAEENRLLRDAIEKVPDTLYKDRYKHGYIVLPKTDDELLPTFTTTVVFQLLALKMSVKKMTLLNKLELTDHGVHPDSPKNVSKSITVD